MADGKKLFDFFDLHQQKDGRYVTNTVYLDDYTTIKGLAARGTLESQPAWVIWREMITLGQVLTIEFLDNGDFTQIWDDYATLFVGAGSTGVRNLFMQPTRIHDEDGKPFTNANPVPITLTGGSAAAGGQDGPAKVLPVALTTSVTNLSAAMISSGQTGYNALNLQNRSGVNIEINYVSSWTLGNGWTVDNGTDFFHDITEGPIALYARTLTGTGTIKLLAIDNSA